MKHFFIILLISLNAFVSVNASDPGNESIDLYDPTPPGPRPRVQSMIQPINQVAAEYNEFNVTVFFRLPVGEATITIYDSNNKDCIKEIVNTNIEDEVNISIEDLMPDIYKVEITYGKTKRVGYFIIY